MDEDKEEIGSIEEKEDGEREGKATYTRCG